MPKKINKLSSKKNTNKKKKKSVKVDPITLQVIGGALHTSAREMGHVLYRMSFSSIIRESEDLGAGLFDANFQTLSESDSTPLHIGSIPGYLRGIQETLQDGEWYEGDVVVHNHPYYGSSHSPDLAIAIPVFWKGELVGFSANTAHHIDIGAATPGLIIDIRDVYAEGMLFSGIKLYRKGERNDAIWQFMESNSRTAKMLIDDIEAQIASARLGEQRMKELISEYGIDTFKAACNELLNYTERMMRQQIRAIPDGTYRADGWCDDDGRNRDKKLPIKVAVKVKGDNVTVDLTGSADQVPTAYNVPFEGSTKVAVYCAFRSLLLDQAETESGRAGFEIFEQAIRNATPAIEVRSRRVGGANYQVPTEIRPSRKLALAMRWIVTGARQRSGRGMSQKLSAELLDASRGQGAAVRRKEEVFRMAEANRAFAHYRW